MSSGTEGGWLAHRPAEEINADNLLLLRADPSDIELLVAAVNNSLEHLRPWMPWAQSPATTETIEAFLHQASLEWDSGHGFQYAMRRHGSAHILRYCGLHASLGPGALEIGYWVHVEQTGRGLATAAAGALTRAALALDEVDRVEIRCDAANARSASIPPRLGYRLDRVEQRPPATPGETAEHMIWVVDRASGGASITDPLP